MEHLKECMIRGPETGLSRVATDVISCLNASLFPLCSFDLLLFSLFGAGYCFYSSSFLCILLSCRKNRSRQALFYNALLICELCSFLSTENCHRRRSNLSYGDDYLFLNSLCLSVSHPVSSSSHSLSFPPSTSLSLSLKVRKRGSWILSNFKMRILNCILFIKLCHSSGAV